MQLIQNSDSVYREIFWYLECEVCNNIGLLYNINCKFKLQHTKPQRHKCLGNMTNFVLQNKMNKILTLSGLCALAGWFPNTSWEIRNWVGPQIIASSTVSLSHTVALKPSTTTLLMVIYCSANYVSRLEVRTSWKINLEFVFYEYIYSTTTNYCSNGPNATDDIGSICFLDAGGKFSNADNDKRTPSDILVSIRTPEEVSKVENLRLPDSVSDSVSQFLSRRYVNGIWFKKIPNDVVVTFISRLLEFTLLCRFFLLATLGMFPSYLLCTFGWWWESPNAQATTKTMYVMWPIIQWYHTGVKYIRFLAYMLQSLKNDTHKAHHEWLSVQVRPVQVRPIYVGLHILNINWGNHGFWHTQALGKKTKTCIGLKHKMIKPYPDIPSANFHWKKNSS